MEESKRMNPFMLNVNMLQRNTLKTTEKCRFIDEILSTVTLCWKKNMTERMRAVDDVRMRTPTEIECSNLNIPNDRLNLHSVQSLLLLCGGCVGIRFTSEELQQLVSLSRACETLYTQVDCLFKSLPQSSKTRRIEVPYHNDHSVEISSSSSGLSSVESGVDHGGEVGSNSSSSDLDDRNIIHLHCLIDSYFELVEQIQKIVKKKNESLPSEPERKEKGLQNFERDPDNISAAGNPIWLSILMRKYEMNKLNRKNEILQHNDVGDGDIVGNKEGSSVPVNAAKGIDTIICTPSDNAKGAIFTIGKFSAFLSCCAVGLIPCKSQELDAFIVLLQASNDSQYKYSTEEEDPISFIRRVQTASEDKSINCQKYFASRFQIFLVNLMELKSTPRDEKSVHAFSSYFL